VKNSCSFPGKHAPSVWLFLLKAEYDATIRNRFGCMNGGVGRL
jgi:hypothetical protein